MTRHVRQVLIQLFRYPLAKKRRGVGTKRRFAARGNHDGVSRWTECKGGRSVEVDGVEMFNGV